MLTYTLNLQASSSATLRAVETPVVDEGKPEDSFGAANKGAAEQEPGALKPIEARVQMSPLAARVCRFDLLGPTCALATYITRWAPFCDRRLHRLVSYINSTLGLKMVSYVGVSRRLLEMRVVGATRRRPGQPQECTCA